MPSIEIDLPPDYREGASPLVVRHEEDALCWFWAYPELFPWPRPVTWLYTPVTGKDRWPGDLWGVDGEGDLLVMECKQCRRSDDPFIDFLSYHRTGRSELSGTSWLKKFSGHWDAEVNNCFAGATVERPSGHTDGILPRSNKREHIRRWPRLAQIMDSTIRSSEYLNTAIAGLRKRAERGDPTPYYIALMVTSDPSAPVLSKKAVESGRLLQQLVGKDFVQVVEVMAERVSTDRLRITASPRTIG